MDELVDRFMEFMKERGGKLHPHELAEFEVHEQRLLTRARQIELASGVRADIAEDGEALAFLIAAHINRHFPKDRSVRAARVMALLLIAFTARGVKL